MFSFCKNDKRHYAKLSSDCSSSYTPRAYQVHIRFFVAGVSMQHFYDERRLPLKKQHNFTCGYHDFCIFILSHIFTPHTSSKRFSFCKYLAEISNTPLCRTFFKGSLTHPLPPRSKLTEICWGHILFKLFQIICDILIRSISINSLIDLWFPSFQCVCACAVELVVLQGPPELYVKLPNHSIHCSQLFMQLLISWVHGLD
jgi:hypothetical protein